FLLGVAIGTLTYVAAGRLGPRHAATWERRIALTLTVVGLVGAGCAAWFLDTELDWLPAVALLAVGVVAFGHVALMTRLAVARTLGSIISSIGAIAVASAAWSAAPRLDSWEYTLLVPPLVATALA